MKKILCCAAIVILASVNLRAQSAPAAAELTKLLNEFLAGASHNDAAMHALRTGPPDPCITLPSWVPTSHSSAVLT